MIMQLMLCSLIAVVVVDEVAAVTEQEVVSTTAKVSVHIHNAVVITVVVIAGPIIKVATVDIVAGITRERSALPRGKSA
jgi:hypothetical protein